MLTTRCPHCHTAFRIRPEQLSVRGGRVRCGHCQQAFSALAQLEELDDDESGTLPPPAVPSAPKPMAASPGAPAPKPVSRSLAESLGGPDLAPKSRSASAQGSGLVGSSISRILPPPKLPTAPSAPPRAPVAPLISEAALASMPVPLSAAEPGAVPQPHAPWGSFALEMPPEPQAASLEPPPAPAATALPEIRAEHSAPGFILDSETLAFTADTAPVKPAAVGPAIEEDESPAVGGDFSMNIVLDANNLPDRASNTKEPDVESVGRVQALDALTVPGQSELGKALGVPAFDPARNQVFDQTVMLEEPIDLAGIPGFENGPESLFDERERQQRAQSRGVEDRRPRHTRPAAWRWLSGRS